MRIVKASTAAVVPGYYLVCYNKGEQNYGKKEAVVPGYYLVCYNNRKKILVVHYAVVPGYYLVCYNSRLEPHRRTML